MTEIPDVYLDLLLHKNALAHLATVMPDGSPQTTPVWFDFTDGKIRVNSPLGSVKGRNMKLGAKVALSIVDPENVGRYVQLRRTVTHVRQDEVAAAHINRLSHRYTGLDRYAYGKPGEVRVMFVDHTILRPGDELIGSARPRGDVPQQRYCVECPALRAVRPAIGVQVPFPHSSTLSL